MDQTTLQTVGLTVMAVAPGLFLLSYFYLRDRYEREPLRLVLRAFFAGAMAALPVIGLGLAYVQPLGERLGWGLGAETVAATLWTAFITAGLLEETFKLLAVWLVAYRHPHFNEPYDGIVYATAAALGFATLENILYVLQGGADLAVARAILSVPTHALFGVIMGYYLGLAKFARPLRASYNWVLALAVPVVLHGLFDVLALNTDYDLAMLLLFPLVAFLWVRATHNIRTHLAASPFRPPIPPVDAAALGGHCPTCGQRVVVNGRFCHRCGANLAPALQRDDAGGGAGAGDGTGADTPLGR